VTAAAGPLYEADDLTHLEDLEAVRKRPGVFIGSTDSRGINHLFAEIVDNSTDEGVAGHAGRIVVTLHPDGSVQVDDDGRGIPTDVHAKSGLSGVELVLTRLHAGGKFGGSGYKTSGGLHGVGASAVNALSRRMDVVVKRDRQVREMSFALGVPGVFDGSGPGAKFTPQPGLRAVRKMKRGESTGTSIRYWYDSRYFETGAGLEVEAVRTKLRNTAFLVPGVSYLLRSAVEGGLGEEVLHSPNGLVDMVDFLTPSNEKPVSGTLLIAGEGSYRENAADADGVMRSNVERRAEVEIALRWGTGYERTIECFTNTIRNVHGGTHRKGFERGAVRSLQDAIGKTRGLLKPKEDPPTLEDMLEGMTAVIHARIPEPQFTSQTKDELSTAGITKVVQGIVERHLGCWVDGPRTKTEARTVLRKIVDAARVRLVQKQQKDAARRKTALEGAAMPPKLVDCRTTGVLRSELFLVEGDSALGCFVGDTQVALASGQSKSFAELADDWSRGVQHFGYTANKAGRVLVAPLIEPRLTKRNAPLVRVTIENDKPVRCTPDHLFYTRDGSYRRAKELQAGDSLMPLSLETPPPVNHSVVSVEALPETADVYDLTVDGYHNLALEADIFVHNSARMARISEYQALLPLRGKILNVQKASLADTLKNAEIASIVQVLGAGTGRTFELSTMRYGRVILMADADVDGSHIRTLLITLFAKYMRPVIEDGRLYAAMPPLHKVVTKGRNPQTHFTFTQREMEETVARLERAGKQIVKPVPRFKGLGEMDADELWDTTMNPATRSVRRITLDEGEAAEAALELLMGEKVEPRRNWLVESSARVDQAAIDI
jgi:DNA gyrase/topoisomerase IV subunit B